MRANEIATSVAKRAGVNRENESQGPKATTQRSFVEDTLETSQVVFLILNKPLEIQWERFSSWRKLAHTICYILRWKRLNQI